MTTSADPTAAVVPEPTPEQTQSLSGYLQVWWQGVRGGELGSLPIILGLFAIFVVFGILEDNFLTERNFTNLLLQMAAVATVAIGIVFVLLIGEIDLSVAFVSAVGGVVMTLLLRPDNPGWPWWAAILFALLCTTAIGFAQALVITKAGVPSFVVTLAGLLIWSGVVLILTTQYSTAGTIRVQDERVVDIANGFLSDVWGWILAAAVVVAFALSQFRNAMVRRAGGLAAKPTVVIALQVLGLAVILGAAVWYANKDRGLPYVTVILGVFLVFWSFIAGRTRFGRHVYAVGGSAEAARRAGHQRRSGTHRRLHDQRLHGGRRRDHAGLAAPLGLYRHGRWEPAPARHRRRGHRRHEPLRRRRPRGLGAPRGARDRLDPERHGPARPGVRHEVRHHRPRPAERGAGGRLLQAPPGRSRRRVTTGEGIGVGMLGYAFMGKAHSRAFREARALHAPLAPELVSLSGRTADKVEAARRELGWAEAVTDWREQVADERIGLFDNGGPNALHAEPTIAAARNGKHVLCEKPLGRTADESLEIWREAERAGVVHMCGFNYRFVPAVRLAREMLEAGDLGDLFHFRARYLQSWGVDAPPSWRFDREAAGSGALGDLGAHIVDIGRYLVGEPVAVTAVVKTFIEGHEVDDTFAATVEFDNGVVGTLEASRLARGRINHERLRGRTARAARSPSTSSGSTSSRSPTSARSAASSSPSPSTRSCPSGGRPGTSSAGATRSRTRSTTC